MPRDLSALIAGYMEQLSLRFGRLDFIIDEDAIVVGSIRDAVHAADRNSSEYTACIAVMMAASPLVAAIGIEGNGANHSERQSRRHVVAGQKQEM